MNQLAHEFALSSAIEELDSLLIMESIFMDEFEPQIKWFICQFTDFQRALSNAETEQQGERMDGFLKSEIDAAIEARNIIDDFIIKTACWKRKRTFNQFVFIFNRYPALKRAAIRKLELIKIKMIHILEKTQEDKVPFPDRPPTSNVHKPLGAAESWELLTTKVSPNTLPLDLVLMGTEFVNRKCDGSPLAIQNLSDHLSKVLQRASEQFTDKEDQQPWLYIIDMILADLPLNLKRCLFYFRLFPENFAVLLRRLVALWVAEGLVEPESNKTPECIADEYLQELIDLKMIQITKWRFNGTPLRCRLVSCLHRYLLIRAKQSSHASSVSSTSRTTVGILRLADHAGDNRNFASPNSYKLLQSFLSFDHHESSAPGERISNFLINGIAKGCFQLLRVLDLEAVYKPRLPKELGRLIHLRYLGLRNTYLHTLPSFIGNLANLETLDVKHTFITTLPDRIWRLRKLRHLYLNENHLESFAHRPSVKYLENLQTLWGMFVDEKSPIEGLAQLTNLTRLGISCHLTSAAQQDAMAEWILKLVHLETLKLRSKTRLSKVSDLKLKHFTNLMHLSDLYLLGRLHELPMVNELPPNLTSLSLSASKLNKDPMETLERMPSLRNLRLYPDSYIGKHMVCSSSGFKQLRVLEIWKLEIEEWTVEKGAMSVLRKLEIRSCKHLKMLPVELQQITTLEELKLTDMPTEFTKELKANKDEEWYKNVAVHYINWNSQNSSKPSSPSSSSSLGSRFLTFLLLERLRVSIAHHAKVKGVPALTYVR